MLNRFMRRARRTAIDSSRTDLLEHNRKTGQLWIRQNLGAGSNQFDALDVAISFRSQAGTTGQDWRIVVADFNGDNYADIADVHVPSFQFWVHPNVGGWQLSLGFWSPVTTFVWPNFTAVFGDFDADGLADYADVNRVTGEIWTHKNLGAGVVQHRGSLRVRDVHDIGGRLLDSRPAGQSPLDACRHAQTGQGGMYLNVTCREMR
jgi:hypothetical protein